MDKTKHLTEEVKEDFCGACLVTPLIFAGMGMAAAGGTLSGKHRKWKKALLISAVITLLMCVGFGVYYLMNKDNCIECKLKN